MIADALTWGFSFLNIYATILNVRKAPISYLFWTFCNIFWLCFDIFVSHLYARVLIDIINLTTSTYGFIVWNRSKKSKRRGRERQV